MQSNNDVFLPQPQTSMLPFYRTNRKDLSQIMAHWLRAIDPVYWVLLFFGIVHLVGITDPPLEMAHSWRQSFTAMVTRNYVENGMDWLHPRIDMAGEKSGIVGAEFPLFNYLSMLLSRCFGYQHWYGRLVNLTVVLWGAYHFYQLLLNRFSKRVAFYSVVVLLSSSWFTFSRKIMPDTFSVSLVLVGMRYGFEYWRTGRWFHWLWAVVFIALGVLSKIPAMSLLAVAGILLLVKTDNKRRVAGVILGSVIAVVPSIWWYFSWVPHLNATYGYHLYFPKGLLEGWHEIKPLWRLLLEKFYFTSYYSFLALLMGVLGLWAIICRKLKLEAMALATITLVFGVFILKTGAVFPQHTYYSIPFIPVMALLAGLGLDFLSMRYHAVKGFGFQKNTVGHALLFLLLFEAISNQIHDHFIKPSEQYKLSLETEIAAVIPMDAKVVLVSSASPQELFLLHRKGWTIFPEQLLGHNSVENYRKLGAAYVVLNKPVLDIFASKGLVFRTLNGQMFFYESAHYTVYRLRR
jgi:4-amino-4-deoxy-L-arabinose transferase-like glycosyltransferase